MADLEYELIMRSADRIKAAAVVCQRTAYPGQELLWWICENRNIDILVDNLMIDASVAKSIAISGESKALSFVKKTMAVDLAALRDTLRHLQLQACHVPSEFNIADLWTKAVTGSTLEKLLSLIARVEGYRKYFSQA